MKTLAAELARLALTTVSREVAAGHYNKLNELGIPPDLAPELGRLSVAQLQAVENMATHYIQISIQPEKLRRAVESARRKTDEEQQIEALLLSRAPAPLMRRLYGMPEHEFSGRRRSLGLRSKGGGKVRQDIAVICDVLACWEKYADSPEAERWLATAEDSGADVRTCWQIVTDAEKIAA